VADAIAKRFNLRRVSAGIVFRQLAAERGLSLEEFSKVCEGDREIDKMIDNGLKEAAEEGNAVIDGQLAGWMAGENADLKILLTAPTEVRVRRIAERDGTDYDYALQETLAREASEKDRYYDYYGIDISDHSIYDLIVDTKGLHLGAVIDIVSVAVEDALSQ
jgi:cytidylate kinase